MGEVTETTMSDNGNSQDSRWHCYSCDDLDYLNDEGLCRNW